MQLVGLLLIFLSITAFVLSNADVDQSEKESKESLNLFRKNSRNGLPPAAEGDGWSFECYHFVKVIRVSRNLLLKTKIDKEEKAICLRIEKSILKLLQIKRFRRCFVRVKPLSRDYKDLKSICPTLPKLTLKLGKKIRKYGDSRKPVQENVYDRGFTVSPGNSAEKLQEKRFHYSKSNIRREIGKSNSHPVTLHKDRLAFIEALLNQILLKYSIQGNSTRKHEGNGTFVMKKNATEKIEFKKISTESPLGEESRVEGRSLLRDFPNGRRTRNNSKTRFRKEKSGKQEVRRRLKQKDLRRVKNVELLRGKNLTKSDAKDFFVDLPSRFVSPTPTFPTAANVTKYFQLNSIEREIPNTGVGNIGIIYTTREIGLKRMQKNSLDIRSSKAISGKESSFVSEITTKENLKKGANDEDNKLLSTEGHIQGPRVAEYRVKIDSSIGNNKSTEMKCEDVNGTATNKSSSCEVTSEKNQTDIYDYPELDYLDYSIDYNAIFRDSLKTKEKESRADINERMVEAKAKQDDEYIFIETEKREKDQETIPLVKILSGDKVFAEEEEEDRRRIEIIGEKAGIASEGPDEYIPLVRVDLSDKKFPPEERGFKGVSPDIIKVVLVHKEGKESRKDEKEEYIDVQKELVEVKPEDSWAFVSKGPEEEGEIEVIRAEGHDLYAKKGKQPHVTVQVTEAPVSVAQISSTEGPLQAPKEHGGPKRGVKERKETIGGVSAADSVQIDKNLIIVAFVILYIITKIFSL